jgi:HEAT repeat protein
MLLLLGFLLLLSTRVGEGVALRAQISDFDRLLDQVENAQLDMKTRAEAARQLGRLKDPEAVPRLVQLLPGGEDLLTLEILHALGEIRDPTVVPLLQRLSYCSGKLNTACDEAIANCKEGRKGNKKDAGKHLENGS